MSFAGFDEGLADCIHAGRESEIQDTAVVLGERADAQIDAGQIQALPGPKLPADGDFAEHVHPFDLFPTSS
jgi:hypothetical protein